VMRIGIMIGPETRNYAGKVDRLCEDAREADELGFASAWIPQLPQDFDAGDQSTEWLLAISEVGDDPVIKETLEVSPAGLARIAN